MTKSKRIIIDSNIGGSGDIWMRLVSLYTVKTLINDVEIVIWLPNHFFPIVEQVFGNELLFDNVRTNTCNYKYTHLGIAGIFKDILKGQKFLTPYHRVVLYDKRKLSIKDKLNKLIFSLVKALNCVFFPTEEHFQFYQGFLEIIGIPEFKALKYKDFENSLITNYSIVKQKLIDASANERKVEISDYVKDKTVCFPNGTGRQFIPVWWAHSYISDAVFCFFDNDKDAELFESYNLKVFRFKSIADIVNIAILAKWVYTTDSFPSHVVQSVTANASVFITSAPYFRSIAPYYKGDIIHSQVSCHPCKHMPRSSVPLCEAGYVECLNWKNHTYTSNALVNYK